MNKRIISSLAAAVMCVSGVGISVSAEENYSSEQTYAVSSSVTFQSSAPSITTICSISTVYKGFSSKLVSYNGKEGLFITKYSGSSKSITIPDKIKTEYGTYKVIGVASNAFAVWKSSINQKLTSIKMSDNIIYVGKNFFSGGTNGGLSHLKNIHFSKNLKYIDTSAFEGCFRLKKIVLPEKLETVGKYAFKNVYFESGSIYIPKSVKTIGSKAFGYSGSSDPYNQIDFRIYCEKGSAAEEYAEKYGFKCTVLSQAKITDYETGRNSVTIYWDKVSGAKGYRVYRYIGGKWERVIGISDSNRLYYKETGLKSGKTYKYKVKAVYKPTGTVVLGKASKAKTVKTKA